MTDQIPTSTPPTPPAGGSGLAPNIASVLCYLCGWVTGVIFLLIEKDNKEVRFNAWQSIVLGGGVFAGWIVLSILAMVPGIGFLFGLISVLLWLAFVALTIVCMVKAYSNERFKIPFIGDIAEQQASK